MTKRRKKERQKRQTGHIYVSKVKAEELNRQMERKDKN